MALSEESLALCRQIGYAVGISFNLRFLSRSVGILGDPARSTRLLEEALSISQEIGDKGGVAEAYKDLAHAAHLADDPVRAIEMLRISIPAHRELEERWLIAMSLHDLAGVMTLRGARGLQASTPSGMTGASGIGEAHDDLLTGVRLFGAAEALRETCNVMLPVPLRILADRDLAVLHEHLDDDAFGQAWAEGREMSFEAAVEHALTIISRVSAGSGDPGVGGPAAASSPDGHGGGDLEVSRLTPREREVAVLVARGLTNRQMAESLVLSERTVDSHVRSILSKLALTSRTQIAAWVVESGLGRPR
jgi:DNA-binding CsgD family transcriptional regulator